MTCTNDPVECCVILDVGGMDTPLSDELLNYVDILSPNEVRTSSYPQTELARVFPYPKEKGLDGMIEAAKALQKGHPQLHVLLKLGAHGIASLPKS